MEEHLNSNRDSNRRCRNQQRKRCRKKSKEKVVEIGKVMEYILCNRGTKGYS